MKHYFILLSFIVLLSILAVVFLYNRPLYNGPVTDHFDGRRFFYKDSTNSFMETVKWMWEMETVPWPVWVNDTPQPKPVERVNKGELKVTYINHATILIQIDGVNILTDPIWSERAGPFSWLGAGRVRAPGIKTEDLPKVDFILISHDHYDHLDLKTLKLLVRQSNPKILAGLGVKALLSQKAFPEVIELDWWQEHNSKDIKYTFVPAKHSSGRLLTGPNKTLWGGFVLEGPSGKVYFAGDTGYGDFIDEIRKRFGSFRLTLLPIGSYEKRWFMKNQHMNPEDSVQVHRLLESEQSAGYHYATFKEHPEQTIDAHEKDLSGALTKYGIPESEFWILKFGEGRYVSVR